MDSPWPAHFRQSFSQREVEVLRLMKEGLSNRDIAQRLSLSLETIKWYNQQIFGKLGVSSRVQAVEKAMEAGLIGAWVTPFAGEAGQPLPARPKHNLPAPLTSFIGRKKERAELRVLLHSSTTRLVTILGPGGIGKTRLALRVAEEVLPSFEHGVWLVDLAAIEDPGRLPQVVANTLGIRDSSGESYENALVRHLFHRALLLVLDNCEHLAEACAQLITYLLTRCTHLRILATSREALKVAGEAFFPLTSLSFPMWKQLPAVEALKGYEAVQLFTERAGLVCQGFTLTHENAPAVAQICQQLDGIPLGLELAAARANFLSMEQIASRLENCFPLLAASERSTIPRHQTMKACLDWSYQLLNEREQVLLRRLAIFAGGWTLSAAEEVCTDKIAAKLPAPAAAEHVATEPPAIKTGDVLDLLNELVNKSMVAPENQPGREMRFRLLEPIRQYLFDKCEQAGEVDTLRNRHLACYIDIAEQAMIKPFQNVWTRERRMLIDDLENTRAALGWALSDPQNPRVDDGLRLASAMSEFWEESGMISEGRAWLSKALDWTARHGSHLDAVRARALEAAGTLAAFQGKPTEAEKILQEGVDLCRQLGDEWHLVILLMHLGLWTQGINPDNARLALEESVLVGRRVGDPVILSEALLWLGEFHRHQGNLETAARLYQESLDLIEKNQLGGGACYPLAGLGYIALANMDLPSAYRCYDEYLRWLPDIDDQSLVFYAGEFLARMAYLRGNFREMESFVRKVMEQCPEFFPGIASLWQCYLGTAFKRQGSYRQAAILFTEVVQRERESQGWHFVYASLAQLAGIMTWTHQPVRAAHLFGSVEALLADHHKSLNWLSQREYERDVSAVREMLSEEEFCHAWEEGRSRTLEEAVREGLAFAEALVK